MLNLFHFAQHFFSSSGVAGMVMHVPFVTSLVFLSHVRYLSSWLHKSIAAFTLSLFLAFRCWLCHCPIHQHYLTTLFCITVYLPHLISRKHTKNSQGISAILRSCYAINVFCCNPPGPSPSIPTPLIHDFLSLPLFLVLSTFPSLTVFVIYEYTCSLHKWHVKETNPAFRSPIWKGIVVMCAPDFALLQLV